MKGLGIIERSCSPWSSTMTLVRKKDGTTRFCVDYWKLNEVTRKDSYLLPKIDDIFDVFHGAEWFCTLDLKSGYWQVEVSLSDRKMTATTGSGLWRFTVMPFEFCNAPTTFEHLMETVLRRLIGEKCLVRLVDVVVFGLTVDELLQRLCTVFEKIRRAGLKLSPKKWQLFQKKLRYYGFLIFDKKLAIYLEKTNAVPTWATPKDAHEVRSFF